MNDSTAVIIKTVFDYKKPALIIETDWYFLAGIVCLIVLYVIYQKKIKAKLQNIFVQETSFEINTGLFKYNQKIKRSYQNLYVAHRIYIELVTRKAAIPIDVDKDVLVEVYNSWYSMFKTIREEIKNLPGDYLVNSTYPKGGVSCSKDSFVVNQTLVFQIKFCGKSPALRVAAKR
jgi:hypothetical protein